MATETNNWLSPNPFCHKSQVTVYVDPNATTSTFTRNNVTYDLFKSLTGALTYLQTLRFDVTTTLEIVLFVGRTYTMRSVSIAHPDCGPGSNSSIHLCTCDENGVLLQTNSQSTVLNPLTNELDESKFAVFKPAITAGSPPMNWTSIIGIPSKCSLCGNFMFKNDLSLDTERNMIGLHVQKGTVTHEWGTLYFTGFRHVALYVTDNGAFKHSSTHRATKENKITPAWTELIIDGDCGVNENDVHIYGTGISTNNGLISITTGRYEFRNCSSGICINTNSSIAIDVGKILESVMNSNLYFKFDNVTACFCFYGTSTGKYLYFNAYNFPNFTSDSTELTQNDVTFKACSKIYSKTKTFPKTYTAAENVNRYNLQQTFYPNNIYDTANTAAESARIVEISGAAYYTSEWNAITGVHRSLDPVDIDNTCTIV